MSALLHLPYGGWGAEEVGGDHVHYSGMLLAALSDDVMQLSRAERSNNSRAV